MLSRVAVVRSAFRKMSTGAKNTATTTTTTLRLTPSPSSSGLCRLRLLLRPLSTTPAVPAADKVSVTFVKSGGEELTATAKTGENLLDVVVDNELDIDGFGACEGTLACSTCHLIFKPEDFARIPDEATDEELDMLDLAYGLTDTSRLGCQVCLTKDMDGMVVQVPEGVNDQR